MNNMRIPSGFTSDHFIAALELCSAHRAASESLVLIHILNRDELGLFLSLAALEFRFNAYIVAARRLFEVLHREEQLLVVSLV
mmetsp:Transcript_37930/g.46228  ORF Transcript_37930/g.46228 Transcript_37930/m.46228 type:complete len:83 (-) Transcript_37930:1294-1542(-)